MSKESMLGRDPRRDLFACLGYFLGSRLLVFALAVVAPLVIQTERYATRPLFSAIEWSRYFNRWDVNWYLQVAREGYQFFPGVECNVVFFPLLPLLLKGLMSLGVEGVLAGVLISNACFFGAIVLMQKLVREETGDAVLSHRAAQLLAWSPAGAWFFLGLTESLYLFLTLLLVLLLRKERWMLAAVIGIGSGLTRPTGLILTAPALVLAFPMILRASRERRWGQAGIVLVAGLGPVLGHALFAFYLQLRFGDGLVYQEVSRMQWGNRLVFDGETLGARLPGLGLRLFDSGSFYAEHVAWSWTLVGLLSMLSLISLWERRAALWHAALILAFLGLHTFMMQGHVPVGPIARYAAVVPSFYVALVGITKGRDALWPLLLAGSSALLVLQTLLLFAGYHLN